MKQKLKTFIPLIIVLSFLSGCWSRTELDEMAIATAIAVDKKEEGYLVTAQVLNPGEIAGQKLTNRTEVSTYQTTGETIFEALRKLTSKSPRKIYLAHIREIVFGEEIAKEGIRKTLDFFSRDHELRTDFFIVVAKNTEATNILKVLTPLDKIPANKIHSTLQTSTEAWAPTTAVTLDELITNLTSNGSNPVLTGIELEGDPQVGTQLSNVENVDSPTGLKLTGLAGFKGGKLAGWLSLEESTGYNYIKGYVESTVVNIPCKDGVMAIEVVQTESKVTGKVENGVPAIKVQLKAEANVGEVQCQFDLTKPEAIDEIEKLMNEKAKKLIENSIQKAQEDLQSDIFGFGEVIHRANPKAWKNLKEDWDQEFSDLSVDVKADFEIRRLGTIHESFQEEKEE